MAADIVNLDTLLSLILEGDKISEEPDQVTFLLRSLQGIDLKALSYREQLAICSKVKLLLNSKTDYWIGYCLLAVFITSSDDRIVTENLNSWTRTITSHLNKDKNVTLKNLIYRTTCAILEFSRHYDNISREIATKFIPSLLLVLTESKTESNTVEFFQVLCACIIFYPGPCGSFKVKIQKMCVNYFEEGNHNLRLAALYCFSLTSRCGPGGEKKQYYVHYWKDLCVNVVEEILLAFTLLTSPSDESKLLDKESTVSMFQFQPMPRKDPDRSILLEQRISILFELLSSLIGKSFPSAVNVPIEKFLVLLKKILGMDYIMKKSKLYIEQFYLSSFKPFVLNSAIKFCTVLFTQFGTLLLPYAETFCQLLTNCCSYLSHTGSQSRNFYNSYLELKVVRYNAVSEWYKHICPGSKDFHLMESVTELIIKDISLGSHKSDRKSNTQLIPCKKGKKGKQKLVNENASDTNINSKDDPYDNSQATLSALQCLRNMIHFCGSLLPTNVYERILSIVIDVSLTVFTIDAKCNSSLVAPYGCSSNRLELAIVTDALVHLYHPSKPCPLPILVHILKSGTSDCSLDVAAYCKTALQSCDKILHPCTALLRSELNVTTQGYDSVQEKMQLDTTTLPVMWPIREKSIDVVTSTMEFADKEGFSSTTKPVLNMIESGSTSVVSQLKFNGANEVDNEKVFSTTVNVEQGKTIFEEDICDKKHVIDNKLPDDTLVCTRESKMISVSSDISDLVQKEAWETVSPIPSPGVEDMKYNIAKRRSAASPSPIRDSKSIKIDEKEDDNSLVCNIQEKNPLDCDVDIMLQSFVDSLPDSE